MPLYSFECTQCHAHFEVRATFKEKDAGLNPECPLCHGMEVRQLIPGGLVVHSEAEIQFSGPACDAHDGPGCCQ